MTAFGRPTIGWFMLSEADRASANRYLSQISSEGTRDELGFAPIHFAFADRFFPGTSVQHAQVRYVFFVAWTYQELLARTAGQRFPLEDLIDIERRFSLRLMQTLEIHENSGISGWTKYRDGHRPEVRASTIYWAALRQWGMMSPLAGLTASPTEAQLRAMWPHMAIRADGDDGVSSTVNLFEDLPEAPPGWRNKTGKLDFTLRPCEARYLQRRWKVAGNQERPPLLSRLAERGITPESLWSPEIRRVANAAEQSALVVAERGAALACIARAAHSALVEAKRNEDCGRDDTLHADAFPLLREKHRDTALALDIADLQAETGIDARLSSFIAEVMEWLADGGSLKAISRTLEIRERDLKDSRAFLLNEKRRRDWRKAVAGPLDYRWPVVRRMIESVRAVS